MQLGDSNIFNTQIVFRPYIEKFWNRKWKKQYFKGPKKSARRRVHMK